MELLVHGCLLLVGLVVVVLCFGATVVKGLPHSPYFPRWISIWLAISSLICVWDAAFVLTRPWSFDQVLWAPYKDYVQVDKLYASMESDFVWSQSVMNLVEVTLNCICLGLLQARQGKTAAVVALVVNSLTCAKTILYFVMEISCGFCNTKHNNPGTFCMLYILPNGVWIWVPLHAAVRLGALLGADEETQSSKRRD